MENSSIEVIKETKLLCVIVNDRLTWDSNTMSLIKRANARMRLLHKLVDFGVPEPDLVHIYILYVRSILEQSCQVWHSSLTLDNIQSLERVQKTALKIILHNDYVSYSNTKNCLKHQDMKQLFPLNTKNDVNTRFKEKFRVQQSSTERHKQSAIPYMQRLLNSQAV